MGPKKVFTGKNWESKIIFTLYGKEGKSETIKTDKLDDRTYKISPLSWNSEIKEQAEKNVNVQVWWKAGEAEPRIRYFTYRILLRDFCYNIIYRYNVCIL